MGVKRHQAEARTAAVMEGEARGAPRTVPIGARLKQM